MLQNHYRKVMSQSYFLYLLEKGTTHPSFEGNCALVLDLNKLARRNVAEILGVILMMG